MKEKDRFWVTWFHKDLLIHYQLEATIILTATQNLRLVSAWLIKVSTILKELLDMFCMLLNRSRDSSHKDGSSNRSNISTRWSLILWKRDKVSVLCQVLPRGCTRDRFNKYCTILTWWKNGDLTWLKSTWTKLELKI